MRHPVDRVAVTGGAGFIGSHLVDRLLDQGKADVVVLDDLSRGRLAYLARHTSDARFHFVHGDVRDARVVTDVLAGASVVYHLAARSSQFRQTENEEEVFTTNVVGTYNVLKAASQVGVRSLVFASCIEVYGTPIDLPVTEDQPLLAVTWHGVSKVAGEAYCRAFRSTSRLNTSVLRLAHVYGSRDAGHLIPTWLNAATAGLTLQVDCPGQTVDLIAVEHVVEAMVRASKVVSPLPPINIGSGTGTLLSKLARRILRLTGGRGGVYERPMEPLENRRFVANVDRMRQLLGVEPANDPLAGLDRLVESILPARLTIAAAN